MKEKEHSKKESIGKFISKKIVNKSVEVVRLGLKKKKIKYFG